MPRFEIEVMHLEEKETMYLLTIEAETAEAASALLQEHFDNRVCATDKLYGNIPAVKACILVAGGDTDDWSDNRIIAVRPLPDEMDTSALRGTL